MRRLIGILSVLLLVLMILPVAAQEEDQTEPTGPVFGIVDVDAAAVRIGPDFAYDAIDEFPRDTSVVIVGRAGTFYYAWHGREWLMIEYSGGYAWIYARLVRTSQPFNSLPIRGRLLPRDRNGRVPEGLNLSSEVCSQWVGEFSRSGDFMAGDASITLHFSGLQGATLYRVTIIDNGGFHTRFDSEDPSVTIDLVDLKLGASTYTWEAAPYWVTSNSYYAQPICEARTGGTFDKPERWPSTGD